MKYFLGLDTSNYTSSLAVCSAEGEVVQNIRLPLPVKEGQMGLRQSDACFLHVKNFSELTTSILGGIPVGDVLAVGVSDRPRDIEGSYMPCFLVGLSSATLIANLLGLPLYRFSHQQGHIAAALYGGGALSYLQGPFLAFHVSGGTTEAVLVEPDGERICKTTYLAGSLDLKAGQAVDRVGGCWGCPFPPARRWTSWPARAKSATGPTPPSRVAIAVSPGSRTSAERCCRRARPRPTWPATASTTCWPPWTG